MMPVPQEVLDALSERGYDAADAPLLLTAKALPLSFDKFVFSADGLGKSEGFLWPQVRERLNRLNAGPVFFPRYSEALFASSIGSGKSLSACLSILYRLHALLCLKDPAQALGLASGSELVVILHSLSASHATSTDFATIAELVETGPIFKQASFKPARIVDGEIEFPGRVILRVATDRNAIGQNVVGGIVDEVNYLQTISNSKRATTADGTYNQAAEVYSAIAARRQSRFGRADRGLPGLLCLVSSPRAPGDFLSVKVAEAATNNRIFVSSGPLWEIQPPDRFSKERIRVFAGDPTRQGRVLEAGEEVVAQDQPLVLEVPKNLEPAFRLDIDRALRDLAGVAVASSRRFFTDREAISRCFGMTRSVCSLPSTDFATTVPEIETFPNSHLIRAMHFDLSRTTDATGVVVAHMAEVRKTDNGLLPVFVVDMVLRVLAPKGGEIQQSNLLGLVRTILATGVNLQLCSMDSYQSTYLRQSVQGLWNRHNQIVRAGERSADTHGQDVYALVKLLAHEGLLSIPEHPVLSRELLSLEIDLTKSTRGGGFKIDHPPGGSKDLADALACCLTTLYRWRGTWFQHGITSLALPMQFAQIVGGENTAQVPTAEARRETSVRRETYCGVGPDLPRHLLVGPE